MRKPVRAERSHLARMHAHMYRCTSMLFMHMPLSHGRAVRQSHAWVIIPVHAELMSNLSLQVAKVSASLGFLRISLYKGFPFYFAVSNCHCGWKDCGMLEGIAALNLFDLCVTQL